jgi:hypothetical protein
MKMHAGLLDSKDHDYGEDEEDDFMSDKYLQLAERDVDAKLRKGKLEEQKYDTKVKHSDKLKDVMES